MKGKMITMIKKLKRTLDDCDVGIMICNILMVVLFALMIICIASWIINEHNKIDSGIVIDKHHTRAHTTPTRFGMIRHSESYKLTIKGEKNGKTVEYTFDCSEEEYDSYDIGDEYPNKEE
jgi:ATP/ADP translocase